MAREHPKTAISRRHFERLAAQYDEVFVRNMHAYDDMHDVILALLPSDRNARLRLLELGAGTGNLTKSLLDRLPRASVIGYDLSESMLERARPKLAFAGRRVELRIGDMSTADFQGPFDAIVSAVAMHHVPPRSKPRLLARLHDALRPGGVLVVGDAFRAPAPELAEAYERLIVKHVEGQGTDMTAYREHRRRAGASGGTSARVEDYVRWMRQAGFGSVDCAWKHFTLAVVWAKKAT